MRSTLSIAVLALVSSSAPAVAGGVIHDVTQVGQTFSPAVITAAPGDTVRWTRTAGSHTVTSGSNCSADGVWFNAPLNASNPTFEWVVPDGAPSEIPYFCTPHCGAGMVGSVLVEAPACPGDLDGSGDRGFADLLQLLAGWGACDGCPEDLDGSGAVDFNDLLQLLAVWGPC